MIYRAVLLPLMGLEAGWPSVQLADKIRVDFKILTSPYKWKYSSLTIIQHYYMDINASKVDFLVELCCKVGFRGVKNPKTIVFLVNPPLVLSDTGKTFALLLDKNKNKLLDTQISGHHKDVMWIVTEEHIVVHVNSQ